MQNLHLAGKTLSLALTAPTNRLDGKRLSPADVEALFRALQNVVATCTNANMAKLRARIQENIAPRKDHLERLIAYLIIYANSIGGLSLYRPSPHILGTAATGPRFEKYLANGVFIDGENPNNSSVKRRKLNLLFVINDMLLVRHKGSKKYLRNVTDAVYPRLPELIQAASKNEDFCTLEEPTPLLRDYKTTGTFAVHQNNSDHWHCHFKILESLQMWYDKKLFTRPYLIFLKKVAMESADIPIDAVGALADSGKEINVALPLVHGHPKNRLDRQPATALLRGRATETSITIDPRRVASNLATHKPLEPASSEAISAVEELIAMNKDRRIKQKKKVKPGKKVAEKAPQKKFEHPDLMDHDKMSRRIVKMDGGAAGVGKTYYGWSQAYCEQRNKKMEQESVGDGDTDY